MNEPTPEHDGMEATLEVAEIFSRENCQRAMALANGPAKMKVHNDQASRIVTMRGVGPMQKISPQDLMFEMLSGVLRSNAAILNEQLIARGCKPEIRGKINRPVEHTDKDFISPKPENGGKP